MMELLSNNNFPILRNQETQVNYIGLPPNSYLFGSKPELINIITKVKITFCGYLPELINDELRSFWWIAPWDRFEAEELRETLLSLEETCKNKALELFPEELLNVGFNTK